MPYSLYRPKTARLFAIKVANEQDYHFQGVKYIMSTLSYAQ